MSRTIGRVGDELDIYGNMFADTGNQVRIGGSSCHTISESSGRVRCSISRHQAGTYDVELLVPDVGLANAQDFTFTYSVGVTDVHRVLCPLGPCNTMVITDHFLNLLSMRSDVQPNTTSSET